jgi:hypothetical protein
MQTANCEAKPILHGALSLWPKFTAALLLPPVFPHIQKLPSRWHIISLTSLLEADAFGPV